MTTSRPAATSPRERPAKPALSREWIVSATVEIMRREGLQAATMRRVAQSLDTGPASLYAYVANTSELHAAVLESLLAELRPRGGGGWRTRLHRLLGDYRDLLVAYPGLARSALVVRPSGPNTIALLDGVLGLLLAGGMDAARAAWAVDLLLLYATSISAEHSPSTPDDVDATRHTEWRALTDAVRNADPVTAPNVAAHAGVLLRGHPDQRWSWAIDVLLDGAAGVAVPKEKP